MSVLTVEGIIEGDRIRLIDPPHLPDNTRVYVVVPNIRPEKRAHMVSPRLRHSEQISDFELEITEEVNHGEL